MEFVLVICACYAVFSTLDKLVVNKWIRRAAVRSAEKHIANQLFDLYKAEIDKEKEAEK